MSAFDEVTGKDRRKMETENERETESVVSLKPRGKCLQRQVNSIKEGQDFGEPWVCKEEVGVAGEGTFSQVASGCKV